MQDAVLVAARCRRPPRCRRAVPRDRLPLRRDPRHPRRGGPGLRRAHRAGRARADRRRAGRACAARTSSPPTPNALLPPAQGRAAAADARRATTPGSPASAASRPRPARRRPLVTWDERHELVKINPIAHWTDEQMDAYIREHAVLVNPLVGAGYPSIGCAPCTAKPAPGADPRSGRWAGTPRPSAGCTDDRAAVTTTRLISSTPSSPRPSTSCARSPASSTAR